MFFPHAELFRITSELRQWQSMAYVAYVARPAKCFRRAQVCSRSFAFGSERVRKASDAKLQILDPSIRRGMQHTEWTTAAEQQCSHLARLAARQRLQNAAFWSCTEVPLPEEIISAQTLTKLCLVSPAAQDSHNQTEQPTAPSCQASLQQHLALRVWTPSSRQSSRKRSWSASRDKARQVEAPRSVGLPFVAMVQED